MTAIYSDYCVPFLNFEKNYEIYNPSKPKCMYTTYNQYFDEWMKTGKSI